MIIYSFSPEMAASASGLARFVEPFLVICHNEDVGVPVPAPDHQLFRFGVETCLLTRTTGHGDFAPQHTTWQDPAG